MLWKLLCLIPGLWWEETTEICVVKENVLNDSWNESITQDEICEIVSFKE